MRELAEVRSIMASKATRTEKDLAVWAERWRQWPQHHVYYDPAEELWKPWTHRSKGSKAAAYKPHVLVVSDSLCEVGLR